MPPRFSNRSIAQCILQWARKEFVCPSCLFLAQTTILRTEQWRPRMLTRAFRRSASNVASVTAVNAIKDITPKVRELHSALSALQESAANYVNLSQIQLALRGLESRDAIIRVAVLGLNGQVEARRLVRLLLADPLAKRSEWEEKLDGRDERDNRALLIRYGEETEYSQRNSILRTLAIPSPILHDHHLEIIVSDYKLPGSFEGSEDQTPMLIPALETPLSANGRHSMITYPVHKTLAHTTDFKTFIQYMSLSARDKNQRRVSGMLFSSFDIAGNSPQFWRDLGTCMVDKSSAEAAIVSFRQSAQNSSNFERGWLQSGVQPLKEWMLKGSHASHKSIKPAQASLIQFVLDRTEDAISEEEARTLSQTERATISDSIRLALNLVISNWAEAAHIELRDSLDGAFYGRKSWKRINWWKLFWRVDDVGYIASNILHQHWLLKAEMKAAWVGGMLQQAGFLIEYSGSDFLPGTELTRSNYTATNRHRFGGMPPPPRVSDVIEQQQALVEQSNFLHSSIIHHPPISQTIFSARHNLCKTTIPPLQSLAQRLVLQTLTTITLTSTLSTLLYISISTTSIYEAGTIAAFGFIISIRRLQRKWETARSSWEGEVREEARKVSRDVEVLLRGILKDGGRVHVDERSIEERRKAMEMVANTRRALEALNGVRDQ